MEMDYINIKNMKQFKFLLLVSIVLINTSCNKNVLYEKVYCEITKVERNFYKDKYKEVDVEIDSAAKEKTKNAYFTVFNKLSNKNSKYYIDTLSNFKLYWNSSGPGTTIWGMVWNADKIIKFSLNIYSKREKVEMVLISNEQIIEKPAQYVVYDLINKWDIESIERMNWKTITEVYSDTTLMNFVDSLNKVRNYNLAVGTTTDPPVYTAAKVDLSKSEIETIIFQLP